MKQRRQRSLDEELTLQQLGAAGLDSAVEDGAETTDELRELLATAALLKAELAPPTPPSDFRRNARIRLENRFRADARPGLREKSPVAAAALSLRSAFSQLLTGASMLVTAVVILLMVGLVRPVSVAGDPIDLALKLVGWRPSAAQIAATERTSERMLSAVHSSPEVVGADIAAVDVGGGMEASQQAFGEAEAAPMSVAELEATLHAERSAERAYVTTVALHFPAQTEPAIPSARLMVDPPAIRIEPEDVNIHMGPRDRGFWSTPRSRSRDVNAQFMGPRANDPGSRDDRPWSRPWNRGGQARRPGRLTG